MLVPGLLLKLLGYQPQVLLVSTLGLAILAVVELMVLLLVILGLVLVRAVLSVLLARVRV